MSGRLDLGDRDWPEPERPCHDHFRWEELAALWDGNDLAGAHDWLNQRWTRLVRNRVAGQMDPEAQFLQGLAFAVLALHFAQVGNQEGARLMIDDALMTLARFRPRFLGVGVEPIVATLAELQTLVSDRAPDADCLELPFAYRKFEYRRAVAS